MTARPNGDAIAIVGLGCRYPDADSPTALWELVLAQRQAFRALPPERLPVADYGGTPDEPDVTYGLDAAVLTNWQFDRAAFRVAGSTHRTTDPSHWLALECAARALHDAGFAGGEGLPRPTTAVIVGNSLTGDYSRAAALRLRWPYARRALATSLRDAGVNDDLSDRILRLAETRYKAPLPAVDEETLAGWLSNTIAGRVCNHFGFGGGGYVVDGACSSSLLAVATACDALRLGSADVALAGGVDLSLDPFELIGFAKTHALADGEMRVYDRDARGFIPGEGCGFAVLMREGDARERGCRIYACVRGWGVSSDGHGGMTRPTVEGQRRAIARAYAMAGFGIDTVGYFEGHGTGTAVGDAVELSALDDERRAAGTKTRASIGSIKANIGHTKAAAGIGGLIKAALAIHARIVPPTTGCALPNDALMRSDATLRVERSGRAWPEDAPVRASVSAMGFGGINAHVVLDAVEGAARPPLTAAEDACLHASQDCELIPLAAADRPALIEAAREVRRIATTLSRAELTDWAVAMQRQDPGGRTKAAIVASTPRDVVRACTRLEAAVAAGDPLCSPAEGVFWGDDPRPRRFGFLFPGQASPSHSNGGAWLRRFPLVSELFDPADGDNVAGTADTVFAQPAIVRASVAGLRLLLALGIDACAAVGHSLGELCALSWSGAFDEAALQRLTAARALAMGRHGVSGGGMASVGAGRGQVQPLLTRAIVIGAINGPAHTVVSGPREALQELAGRCAAAGIGMTMLRVSHAFHSPAMAAAVAAFDAVLNAEAIGAASRRVISTITGGPIHQTEDLRALLRQQILSPVLFDAALTSLLEEAEVLIEVGPGRVLTGLAAGRGVTVIALDAGGPSVRGLLDAAAAAFCCGHTVRWSVLTHGRFARPFDPSRPSQVLINPCESGHVPSPMNVPARPSEPASSTTAAIEVAPSAAAPIETACAIVAARAELPRERVRPDHRLLSDLHLNSISATQVIVDIARALSCPVPTHAAYYADATIAAVVDVLSVESDARPDPVELPPAGVRSWTRAFEIRWVPEPRALRPARPAAPTAVLAYERNDQLAAALRVAVAAEGCGGMIACLPRCPDSTSAAWLLREAREAMRHPGPLVIVQRQGGGSAVARSIWLEAPDRAVAVVNIDVDDDAAVATIVEEARACTGFEEVRVSRRERQVPRAVGIDVVRAPLPVGRDDVVLITGGGKGITAECALALAMHTGARLGIIGRGARQTDESLERNLTRLGACGVDVKYWSCDLTDDRAVHAVVRDIEQSLGKITVLLHGAAINTPCRLLDLDDATITATLAVKVAGLRHLLDAIDPGALRLCIGFGSLTARTGMRGDSHYAAANDLMADLIDSWTAAHASCRGLTIEWSVWAGTGMGERLNSLAALERDGIVPLTVEQGTAAFADLMASDVRGRVMVASRFPQGPTLRLAGGPPPLFRFLERPLVWFPDLEIVADAEISPADDPYLEDHVLGADRVLPGVVGLEAMAQAAAALARPAAALDVEFEDVGFDRPIVVPAGRSRRIRVAALRHGEWIDVVLRSDETLFAIDHFRARCRFVSGVWSDARDAQPRTPATATAARLYRDLLFQRGRFERVAGYSQLHATSCSATLHGPSPQPWFSAFLPADLVMPDPGGHDAAFHAVQVCVPESRLLPTAVSRIRMRRGTSIRRIDAIERGHEGRTYTYDITAIGEDGRLCGEWRGTRLSELSRLPLRDGWPAELLPAALERAAGAAGACDVRAYVACAPTPVISLLPATIVKRADGRPQIAGSPTVNVTMTHDGTVRLAMTAVSGRVGCDVHPCASRASDDWRALLGRDGWQLAQLLMHQNGEPLDIAAGRVWSARECLLKAGFPLQSGLTVRGDRDGWTALGAEPAQILTRSFVLAGEEIPLMIAMLLAPADVFGHGPRQVVA